MKNLKYVYSREADPKASNEFSYSRFLVPYLSNYRGWSLFVDGDVVFLNDTNGIIIGSTETLVFPNNPSNPYWNVCDSISTYLNPNDIKMQRNLIDVLDVYGRKSRVIPNTLLFFIYDNGTIEKRILIN